MSNSFIESIKMMINTKIEKAGYDKTRTGQIVKVNNDNTYSVQIGGWTYPNVITVNDMTYNLYDVVKVVIPCNQATQMYITSSILSDNSMGKKVAYATTMAEEATQEVQNTNRTFYQSTRPEGGNYKVGDQWYSTSEQNKLYVWNGTEWIIGQDSAVVYDIATNTYDIASATEKYFWASNNASVGIGILITQKSQADFIANPNNGGMNLFIHDSQIILRDGLTNLFIINNNGNGQVLGSIVNLYKVTDYTVSIVNIDAYGNILPANYNITRESGYRAVGIVGYNNTDANIRATTNYITDSSISFNPTLTVGFSNSSGLALSNQTATFKILWMKATV